MKSLFEKNQGNSTGLELNLGSGLGGRRSSVGGGAFLTETNTIKIKEKSEVKFEKSPKKPLPTLKEEKIDIKIENTEYESQKVKN
jgi:hypothetical protein